MILPVSHQMHANEQEEQVSEAAAGILHAVSPCLLNTRPDVLSKIAFKLY